MLTGQVFTIMSGTARNEQVEAIIESADKHLYHRERGGYCLNTDFRDPDELPRTVHEMGRHLGRMFGFAYGHKENGAVFSHMTTMYANALYQRGYATAGYKALHTLYRQAANIEQSRIYPGIPEYFDLEGRGLYHYLTGAASWYFLTVVTQMFGVRGHYGDLLLQPKLLPGQFNEAGEAAILVRFAGKKLRVSYHLADAKGASSPSDHYQIKNCQLDQVTVGQVIPRQMIQALDDDSEHLLRVQL
jgi:cellobiose phosphorylase